MITYKKCEFNHETKQYDYSMVTEHVGRSLFVTNESIRVMSDVWEWVTMLYSVTPEGRLTTNIVGGDGMADAGTVFEIDAVDSVYDDIYKYSFETEVARLTYAAKDSAKCTDIKGRKVKVTGGRTAKNMVGEVVVVIERPYSMGYKTSLRSKIGIATTDKTSEFVARNGKVYQNRVVDAWVWAHNCEVVGEVEIDTAKIEEDAKKYAQGRVEDTVRRVDNSKRYFPNLHAVKQGVAA